MKEAYFFDCNKVQYLLTAIIGESISYGKKDSVIIGAGKMDKGYLARLFSSVGVPCYILNNFL